MNFRKFSESRAALYILIAANALLLALGAANLTANVFVLKASRWLPVIAWSMDFAQSVLYYSPLLLGLWLRVLLAQSGSAITLRELWRRTPGGVWLALTGAIALSLATSFPFAQIHLTPAGGPTLKFFWQNAVIAGVARPAAALLLLAGLYVLFARTRTAASPTTAPLQNAGRWLGGLFALAALLHILIHGSAVPRLEDEVAYHIQALLFEAQLLRGHYPPEAVGLLGSASLERIVQLPYIFYDSATATQPDAPATYYSAHFHGWSALLALAGQLQLKTKANVLLAILNLTLFAALARRLLPALPARWLAVSLYTGAPALLLLTGTYMSHIAAQTALMALLCIWLRAPDSGANPSNSRLTTGLAVAGLFALYALMPALRLQVLVPGTLAIAIGGVLAALARRFNFRLASAGTSRGPSATSFEDVQRFRLLPGLLFLGTALMAGFWIYDRYVTALGADGLFFTRGFMDRFFEPGCQAIGFGPGHGCFPTYGTLGHSFRKFLLNGFDLFSTLNHELSPGSLPLLPVGIVLLARHWRSVLDPRQVWLTLLLLFLGSAGIYSLYFHNGGESYRGRYLFESAFAFYLLLARLVSLEWSRGDWFARTRAIWKDQGALKPAALAFTGVVLLVNSSLTMRGEYFSKFIQPFPGINAPGHFEREAPGTSARPAEIRQAVISVRDLLEQHGDREAGTEAFRYPSEFTPGEMTTIPLVSIKAFLNLGYPTLAATAVRIDQRGFLRDRYENVLVGDAPTEQLNRIRELTGTTAVYRLQYREPRTARLRRGLVRWDFQRPLLNREE